MEPTPARRVLYPVKQVNEVHKWLNTSEDFHARSDILIAAAVLSLSAENLPTDASLGGVHQVFGLVKKRRFGLEKFHGNRREALSHARIESTYLPS
jgi:hypothetical protein